ncbi:MAG: hypothetical protein AB7T49_04190 [Oligoflexales bacterium]
MKHLCAIAISFFALSSCKERTSKVKESVGVCTIAALGQHVDNLLIAASTNCNPNPETMFVANGCFNRGRALVGEVDVTKARKVDVWQCSPVEGTSFDHKNTVLFSHPNEFIATDHATGVHNFYKLTGGTYKFMGDSYSRNNPCKECHTYGELIMKELLDPWPNWVRRMDDHVVPLLGNNADGSARTLLNGAIMETLVRNSFREVIGQYSKKARNADGEFKEMTIQDIVRPLFCESGVTFLDVIPDSGMDLSDNLWLPPTALTPSPEESMLLPFGKSPKFPGSSVEQAYADKHGLEQERSLSPALTKNEFESQLIQQLKVDGVLSRELIVAASILDFPNAIFSRRRCGILKHIPATKLEMAHDAENIDREILKKMSESGDPDVREFVTNLQAAHENFEELKTSFNERFKAFASKCRLENSAVRRMETLYPLYRARLIPFLQKQKPLKYFQKLSVIEHFASAKNSPSAIFSENQKIVDGVYAHQEGLGLTEGCQLNMAIE